MKEIQAVPRATFTIIIFFAKANEKKLQRDLLCNRKS